jgi:predicted nucleic acid-binding protein
MDIYIVDSNLIFSSVLNIKSGIGQFILKSKENNISLYAPKYLEKEINRHFSKIIDRSKLNEEEVQQVIQKIYKNITFINDEIIPFEEYIKAMRLVRNIDPDDVTFVALTNYMDEILWTGDTKLYNGLKKLGYKKVVNFNDLKRRYKI